MTLRAGDVEGSDVDVDNYFSFDRYFNNCFDVGLQFNEKNLEVSLLMVIKVIVILVIDHHHHNQMLTFCSRY